jgi:hypothetical protein
LQWLHMCFPGVSDVCCKCFNYFGRMLHSVSSTCCKCKSSVAHVAVDPAAAVTRGSRGDASGRHGKWSGHRSRRNPMWARAGAGNGAAHAPT